MNRSALLGGVALAVAGMGSWAAWNHFTRLPDCSNEDTVALLNQIVRIELAGTDDKKLLEHFNAMVKVDINAIETLSFTKDPARYTCEAQVNVDLGPEVKAALGIKQELLDNPNFLTAMVLGPTLQAIYGPLENLRVKFTSSWAKDKGETRHYVSARLLNPGATGYATLTEIAWANQQATKTESAPSPKAEPATPAPVTTEATARPPQTPPAKPAITAPVAQKFSDTWLQTMSQAQSGVEIASLYAPKVDFYGKANVSREDIAREKEAFIRRWPERHYRATGRANVVSITGEETVWTQAFSYDVSNGVKSRQGDSSLVFTIRNINGEWLIVDERKEQ